MNHVTEEYRYEKLTWPEINEAISQNIGLRQQERLTSEQASEVAACESVQRDISLNF